MNSMNITGITVSLEIKRSTYGGNDVENRYISIRAEVPEGLDGINVTQALEKSLELQLKAWEAIYGAELAAGKMKSDDFDVRLQRIRTRTSKVTSYLTTTEDPTNG